MVFTATSRAALHDAEKHWLAKFMLRVIAIVVALVAAILIACATAQEDESGYLLAIVWDLIPVRPPKSLPTAKLEGITN